MPKRPSRRRVRIDAPQGDASVDALLDVILPYAPGMLKTIGLAGAATTDEGGEEKPGNIQAASIGLDFIVKALANRAGTVGQKVLDDIRKLRESALAKPQ